MIALYSRYRARQEIRSGNVAVVAVYNKVPESQFMTYTSRDGDSFEKLATLYLGGPVFYWRIAELNPHVLFPDRIPLGTRIRIPR
jgi:nucleoid-associated protein YgaU